LTNRLSRETSPYLLQHAHNPVDWYPWGDEAIQKAREEDKPILVSIGYSACHWCHVMERESFEDPETAALMNRLFVNIKIDREERPDLDQIYMDAVQAIAGNGGWPLNVFLTPEGKPFYGGTYFPPVDLHTRPSWKSVLQSISTAFLERRAEINDQANQLTKHVARVDFGTKDPQPGGYHFKKEDITVMFDHLMKTADKLDGGFGQAPKFPQTFSIRFLLQHYHYTGNPEALDHALFSLDKMIYGGIYDQLGGGFARYSTDTQWLAPHFEKMLYDNALLITVMSEAFQITGKPVYSKAIVESMEFIQRELMSGEGGFFSALDADSEGEEGKFYVWGKNEISELLGKDAEEFCAYYNVSERGNWEGKNILRILHPEMKIPLEKELEWKKKLMSKRALRIRPALDNKILLGWNSLMITACCKAFSALGDENYRDLAIKTIDFLEKNMKGEGIYHFYHSYKKDYGSTSPAESRAGVRRRAGEYYGIPAFLDDYACLIDAYIQLQEVTGDPTYLIRAKELADWVITNFSEEDTGYFYYTHAAQDDLIVRKREIYDGATPSGNSTMAGNLWYLGTVFDLDEWKQRAVKNTAGLKELISGYPGSFGIWATLINAATYQLYEIVLAGSQNEKKHLDFLKMGIPNRVFQVTSATHPDLPLLRNKPVSGPTLFFLCRDYSCQQPVKEVAELVGLIKNS
jgi:uncharacterized protein YyaL (SSP411 family)